MTDAIFRTAVASAALTLTLQLDNEWWRDRALRALAPLLGPEQLAVALNAARALPTPGTRARSLARLAALLEGEERAALALEALAVSATLLDAADRARVVVLALGSLPEDQRAAAAQRALAGAALIGDPWERGVTLAELAAHAPALGRLEVLNTLRGIDDPGARATALAIIARHLPEHVEDAVLDEAVSVAGNLADGEGRARTLASLAGMLDPSRAEPVAQAALAVAEAAGDDLLWGRVLRWTAAQLSPGALAEAWPRAQVLGTPEARVEALTALAASLPEPRKVEAIRAALAAVGNVGDEWLRVSALAQLASHLPAAAQPTALALAETISDPWARADVLSALAAHLPAEQRAPVFSAALAAARAAAGPWPRARALTTVAALGLFQSPLTE